MLSEGTSTYGWTWEVWRAREKRKFTLSFSLQRNSQFSHLIQAHVNGLMPPLNEMQH